MWWENVVELGRHIACMHATVEKYTETFKRKGQRIVATWET